MKESVDDSLPPPEQLDSGKVDTGAGMPPEVALVTVETRDIQDGRSKETDGNRPSGFRRRVGVVLAGAALVMAGCSESNVSAERDTSQRVTSTTNRGTSVPANHENTTNTTTAATTPTTHETARAELLSLQEIERIQAATGIKGLETMPAESLVVTGRYQVPGSGSELVIVSVEGASSTVSNEQLLEMAGVVDTVAELLTEHDMELSQQITLGSDGPRKVNFSASKHNTSQGSGTRYVFIAPDAETMRDIASPVDVAAFPESYTIAPPFSDLTISALQSLPGEELAEGISRDAYYAATESLQAVIAVDLTAEAEMSIDRDRPDMSHLSIPGRDIIPKDQIHQAEKEELRRVGKELVNISLAAAVSAIRAGWSYEQYSELVSFQELTAVPYQRLDARFIDLDPDNFEALRGAIQGDFPQFALAAASS